MGSWWVTAEEFLQKCPTNDPAYPVIRRDFELRIDGAVVNGPFPCTEPFSARPIEQLTSELVVLQVQRTAYYMHSETKGRLPWTDKGLYDWMVASVAGVNMGIACSDPATVQDYAERLAQAANGHRARIVANPPPEVTASEPYGGPCSR